MGEMEPNSKEKGDKREPRARRGKNQSSTQRSSKDGVKIITIVPNRWEVTHRILSSVRVAQNGDVAVTIPAGVGDMEFLELLNDYFRKECSTVGRDAIYQGDYRFYRSMGGAREGGGTLDRFVAIRPIVPDSTGIGCQRQRALLSKNGLQSPSLVDQAIVAVAYACKHQGRDLFNGKWASGAIEQLAMRLCPERGLRLEICGEGMVATEMTVASARLSASDFFELDAQRVGNNQNI